MTRRQLFTSEAVSMGHPDKISDQISDAVLDAALKEDRGSRVACETLVTTGLCVVAGEITTAAYIDIPGLVRELVRDIGYTHPAMGFHPDIGVLVALDRQSPDISQGVTESSSLSGQQGAGDQGMMFGYACNETPELMPMPFISAHAVLNQLTELRRSGALPWVRPDSKAQVTIEYEGDTPRRIHTVVLSTQHDESVCENGGKGNLTAAARRELIDRVIREALPAEYLDPRTIFHVNPTGRFVIGGPHGDCGLTGRKIIVDTYGGMGRHGGGAFSGKDPSKVDRSAAYMARYVAKNLVAAELADRCEVQLAYAIGVAEPVSVRVETYGTARVDEARLDALVREHFSLTPKGIIEALDLLRPIYRQTAAGGHFGREGEAFTWERTDKAAALRAAAGLREVARTEG